MLCDLKDQGYDERDLSTSPAAASAYCQAFWLGDRAPGDDCPGLMGGDGLAP